MGSSTRKVLDAITVLAAAAVPLSACGDDTGPSPALAAVRVEITRTAPPDASASAPDLAVGGTQQITPDAVSSLTVTVTGIECQLSGAAEDSEDGWVTLSLDDPVTLDLLALPVADASPVVIATGLLPVGSYQQVRLFVSAAQISFANDLILGSATFDAGVIYDVTIPSVAQTGIKTDVQFDVTPDGEGTVSAVPLLFDPSATFANATVTGTGQVMLAPVIKAGAGDN
jgi:hypothetical protein